HRLHFLDQEGHVATLAEHRRHDARERDDPLEVLHGLRVHEDLERAALLVLAAGVEHDVVDGHVHGVLDQRRLDLVGAADQHFRALDALVHLDDFGRRTRRGGLRSGGGGQRGCGLAPVICGGDGVTGDFLFDPDGHDAVPWYSLMPASRLLRGGRRVTCWWSSAAPPCGQLPSSLWSSSLWPSSRRPASWPPCRRRLSSKPSSWPPRSWSRPSSPPPFSRWPFSPPSSP